MKTFELQELMDWLEANPDREFNWYNPGTSSVKKDECGCMLYEFFNEKLNNPENIACKVTSPWTCYHPQTFEIFGVIRLSERLSLHRIHHEEIDNVHRAKGSQLLANIKAELGLVTPS